MWVETQPSTQPSLQKLNVDNSCRKHTKLDIRFLKSCPILLYFFTLYQIVWIVRGNKIFDRNLTQSPSHFNFWIFFVSSKHLSNHDVNIKQVSCVKSSKFNDFVLALFYILGRVQCLTLENFQLCPLVVFWRN